MTVLFAFQNCSSPENAETQKSESDINDLYQPMTSNFNDIYNKILLPKCIYCHDGPGGDGDVDLSSYNAIMSSGTVMPSSPLSSLLYISMVQTTMPPDFNDRVLPDDLEFVAAWIQAGAKDPDGKSFNRPPRVNPGVDQYIYDPQTTANLRASIQEFDGDTVVIMKWKSLSGPAPITFDSPNSISTLAKGFTVHGTYEIEFSATDTNGSTTKGITKVYANPYDNKLPIVSVGFEVNLQPPNDPNSTSFTALALDPDGTIESFSWVQTSGPNAATLNNANTATLNVSNLTIGTYQFRVTVQDNKGATASASGKVVVDPPPMPQSFKNINSTILAPRCLNCHRDGNERGGYNVSTYAKVKRNGGVVPNKANESELFKRVHDLSMPAGGLSKTDRDRIRDWINTGALDN